jgi:hypothetical protein
MRFGTPRDRIAPADAHTRAVAREAREHVARVEDVEGEVPARVEEVARDVGKIEEATQAGDLSDQRDRGSAAEEVVVLDLGLQHEVLDRAEACADLEGAREALGDLDVEDDAVLGASWRSRQGRVVEVAEAHHVELGDLFAGLRVEVTLAQHHLAANDLVRGLVVAADVDAFDVDQRALADLEGHVELEVLLVEAGVGDDVDVGVAGVLVAALDVLLDGLDLAHGGDVALLEDRVDRLGEGALVVEGLLAAGEGLFGADAADLVLRALVDGDRDVDEAAIGAERELGVLDARVQVALVAVEVLEHLEVAGEGLLVEDAAGALGDHAEVAADAGQHVLAQLLVGRRPGCR